MGVGFESHTPSGVIQVGESLHLMSLTAKGTATANVLRGIGALLKYVDIAYVGDTPLLAFRPTSGMACLIAATRTGSAPNYNWTFRVLVWPSLGDYSFTYYIFDRPKPSLSTGGLESYDATGKMIFSSTQSLMKIAGKNQIGLPARTYAASMSGRIWFDQTTETYTNGEMETFSQFYCEFAAVYSTGANIVQQTIWGDVSPGGGGNVPQPSGDLGSWGLASQCLVVDVTGL